jgi:hypothetical protein
MARISFATYAPDILDLNSKITRSLRNCVPRGDGFGPMKGLSPLTAALPATCRGYFLARHPTDGTVAIFAGTATKLYLLDNTYLTWTDVSKGAGTYTTLPGDAHWSFCQFGSRVIATQKNDVMQSFTLGVSSAFADLGGSPPQAGWVEVIGPFVVAFDIASNPNRVQWCGFGDPTNWTAGTAQSDLQDLPDGGRVRCGGEMGNLVGVILQENGWRRLVYAAGSATIFQIEKIRMDVGILAPYSLAMGGGFAFFLSTKGFAKIAIDGSMSFIGEERIDRTILGKHESTAPSAVRALALDNGATHLIIGACDPSRNLYLCVYKSQTGTPNLFDKGFTYQWSLDRWGPVEIAGECIEQVALPGVTLEGLDALTPGASAISGCADNGSGLIRVTVGSTSGWATSDRKTITGVTGTTEANGTWTITVIDGTNIDLQGSTFSNVYVSGGVVGGSIDAFSTPLDEISTASLPIISGIDSSHKLGLFAGATLEAQLETAEQQLDGQRMDVNNIKPITDAATVYGAIAKRENLNSEPAVGTESLMDSDGNCPVLEEGNLVRGRLRIPASTIWNYAAGVEIDAEPSGATVGF